jgi:restriction system protein
LKWVEIHQRARAQQSDAKVKGFPVETEAQIEEDETDEDDERELLGVLQGLPPDGFERLCKRLLHEWGFQGIQVLGKSHDGGVDGIAIL